MNIRHPRWLLLFHTLPLVLLGVLATRQYTLIAPLLDPVARQDWGWALLVYLLLLAAGAVMSLVLDARKEPLPLLPVTALCLFTIVGGVGGLLLSDSMLPRSIPRWLTDEYFAFHSITFAMPSLVYGLLLAVTQLTTVGEGARAWKSFLAALAIPAAGYVLVQVVVPLLGGVDGDFTFHVYVILLILATVAFLFLLLRGGYLLVVKQRERIGNYRLAYLIPLGIVFPVLGLAINNGHFSLGLSNWFIGKGVFGDFSHPLFYVIALFNGIYLCLPRSPRPVYRLFLFLIGSAGFTYLLYFVFVFLPYLPLSLLAVIVVGVGWLMLTPLLLLPIHALTLYHDFIYLSAHYRTTALKVAGGAATLMLPLALTVQYLADRHTLHAALDYVYAPAAAPEGQLSTKALARVLGVVEKQKRRPFGFGSSGDQPYLSSLYQWVVLDNLTLSEEKLATLSAVFLGTPLRDYEGEPPAAATGTKLTGVEVNSEWEEARQQWTTWVNLTITADSTAVRRGEYEADIDLPPGTYIDDYYLYVGDRRAHGTLSERRTALWVYNEIVGTSQDPGLLRYISGDRVRLNVFPFASGEERRTGIRFIHREAVSLSIDGQEVQLGVPGEHPAEQPITQHGTTYVPATSMRAGPRVQRIPQVHYLLDGSRRFPAADNALLDLLDKLESGLPQGAPDPVVTLVGTHAHLADASEPLTTQLANLPEGGFFAQRAIEDILRAATLTPTDTVPIIVVVGDGPIFTGDFSAFAVGVPEATYFYRMDAYEGLTRHPLSDPSPVGEAVDRIGAPGEVIAYAGPNGMTHYLATDARAAVIATSEAATSMVQEGARLTGGWRTALALRGQHRVNTQLGAVGYAPWLVEIRGSFRAGVLMPTTAFLVVENEAQQEALRRKQQQVLEADPTLDLEETTRMSEPGWWVLALLLPLLYLTARRRGYPGASI